MKRDKNVFDLSQSIKMVGPLTNTCNMNWINRKTVTDIKIQIVEKVVTKIKIKSQIVENKIKRICDIQEHPGNQENNLEVRRQNCDTF